MHIFGPKKSVKHVQAFFWHPSLKRPNWHSWTAGLGKLVKEEEEEVSQCARANNGEITHR